MEECGAGRVGDRSAGRALLCRGGAGRDACRTDGLLRLTELSHNGCIGTFKWHAAPCPRPCYGSRRRADHHTSYTFDQVFQLQMVGAHLVARRADRFQPDRLLDYNGRAAPGARPAHHPARRLGHCHRYSEFFKVIALTFATMDTSITIMVTTLANAPLITAALGVFTLAERPPLSTPP